MSGEPMHTGLSSNSPSLSLAERYGSFAEYAASTDATPRSAATSLDVARFHAFTGELSFSTDPAVRLYLDGGVVYHAERDGDPAISQILRDVGVVEADQLERGLVRVGDVEHLGRLFDREPSIDRDAVMVVMESRTEAIVRELANRSTASVSVSAYRHHPSGLHRWFVASNQPAESHRPVSAVAQVDRSVVDELPALRAAPASVEIEWSEPDPTGSLPAPLPSPAPPSAPSADPSGGSGDTDRSENPAEPSLRPLSEFHIVWPDGTADNAITADRIDDANVAGPIDAEIDPDPVGDTISVAPVDPVGADEASPTPASMPLPPPVTEGTSTGAPPMGAPLTAPPSVDAHPNPSFSIAPLEVDELPEPDAAVPDDVAAAVKRALQAIESASTGHVSVPELAVSEVSLPEITVSDVAPAPTTIVAEPVADSPTFQPSAAPVEAAPVAFGADAGQPAEAATTAPGPAGFAPPTLDMAAEAVYARAVAAAQDEASTEPEPAITEPSEPGAADPAPAEPTDLAEPTDHPGPGRASVVFVDDEEPAPAADRRGALRRLISSLRSKSD